MHILALPCSRLATSDSSPRHGGGGEAGVFISFLAFLAVADLIVLTAHEFCTAHGVVMRRFLEFYLNR